MSALLFTRDQVDEVDDWPSRLGHVGRHSILWIDLNAPDRDDLTHLADALELADETLDRVEDGGDDPYFGEFDSYLHVVAFAPSRNGEGTELVKISCLLSDRWVATVHEQPVEVLDDFREHAGGSGDVGDLDGPEFLADLLEWVLTGYLDAFEAIELELEEFDTRVMRGEFEEPEDELERLVALRRDVGALRRALVSHRRMFLALTRPEIDAITTSKHTDRFRELQGRLEDVVQAARDSRDSVVGSFDVLVARTGQRTNEIMKVLTLGTVLLLPGALIAGVMGMNFKIGLFDTGWLFWVVCAAIVALAAMTLIAARKRRWI